MADQTVRVANLDNSEARVAFDLYQSLTHNLPAKEQIDAIEQRLQLFVACRNAVRSGSADVSALR